MTKQGGIDKGAGAPAQNLTQFALARGLVTMAEARSHIHAGLRSAPQTKTYQRWYHSETERLLAAAAETDAAYRAAIDAGEIGEPARPTLEERANGHPDLASTQAALRLLAKRRAAGNTNTDPLRTNPLGADNEAGEVTRPHLASRSGRGL